MSTSARMPPAGRLVLERLAQAGCRPTPQRRAVLGALAESDHHGRVRYELVGESHCHFVCLACGRVFDTD